MPLDRISAIMGERTGLGDTGEAYLIGPDRLMRSDARHSATHTVVESFRNPKAGVTDSETARLALEEQATGVQVTINYAGESVISAYTPLQLEGGLNWALLAEIGLGEALVEVQTMTDDAEAVRTKMLARISWSIGIGAIIITLFAFLFASAIARPLRRVRDVLQKAADGDLSSRLKNRESGRNRGGQPRY